MSPLYGFIGRPFAANAVNNRVYHHVLVFQKRIHLQEKSLLKFFYATRLAIEDVHFVRFRAARNHILSLFHFNTCALRYYAIRANLQFLGGVEANAAE